MSGASLRYYACGRTEHDMAQVFRGHASERRTFPSAVYLFEHENGERVLFDTGYAPSMAGTGLKGKLYERILPPEIDRADVIATQLTNDGINPASIGHVILSHLHPDHVGGVRYFSQSRFVLSAGQVQTLQHPRVREGLFRALLPDWFPTTDTLVLGAADMRPVTDTGLRGHDLFGDGSFVVTELPGHARGHLGALVLGKALLAGDAAWGNDVLACSSQMRTLPRLVQHDFAAYQDTAVRIRGLEAAGITAYFSHDVYDRKVLLP